MLVLTGAPISNSRKRWKRDAFKSTIFTERSSKIFKNISKCLAQPPVSCFPHLSLPSQQLHNRFSQELSATSLVDQLDQRWKPGQPMDFWDFLTL